MRAICGRSISKTDGQNRPPAERWRGGPCLVAGRPGFDGGAAGVRRSGTFSADFGRKVWTLAAINSREIYKGRSLLLNYSAFMENNDKRISEEKSCISGPSVAVYIDSPCLSFLPAYRQSESLLILGFRASRPREDRRAALIMDAILRSEPTKP